MSRRGRQTDLSPALDAVIRRLDRKNHGGFTAARVMTAWGRAATGMVAGHTTGVHLRDGVLIVYVDGNSWATHFAAAAEQYRVAVNAELGEELVEAVRFVVSRKVADEHKLRKAEEETEEFYAKDEVDPIPLTDVELSQIQASVAEIPDEGLRQAVYRATVKDLEWKKGLQSQNGPQTTPDGA
jgi:hypothetical protein